jgi:hypothetical protein
MLLDRWNWWPSAMGRVERQASPAFQPAEAPE